MLNDFFINMMLLVAVTFAFGHILKEIPEKIINGIYGKILLGIFAGLTGILLLIYSIQVKGTNTIIDLRSYAIMMASFLGGTIPTIISGSIIALYRMEHFGVTEASILAVVRIVLYIIFFYMIDRKVSIQWKKWLYKALFTFLVITLTNYYMLRHVSGAYVILISHLIILIITAFLEYFLLDYVQTSNELYRRYQKDSTKDFLTGLYNTRQFDKILNLAFERVQKNHETLSCLMVDIDHFKRINDTYGHAVGDIVLKELAEILMLNSRGIDIVGRVGGEEFCILIFNCSKLETFDMALRINKAVQEHRFSLGENKYTNITVSIGLSVYPETISDLEQLKEKADNALYLAKRTGRNRVCD